MIYCSLGGITPIDWDTQCAIFLGYFFGWKINFWVYFIACNKFWVKILALNKVLAQIVMKHKIKINYEIS